MKVYAVVVDFQDERDSVIHGIYRQYRHAYQEEQQILEYARDLFNTEVKVRIIDKTLME